MNIIKRFIALAITASLINSSVLVADGGHTHQHGQSEKSFSTGPHGGKVSQVGKNWCEVVYKKNGIHAYLYDAKGKKISSKNIRGSVTMTIKGNPKKYNYDLYPDSAVKGEENALFLSLDLSRIPDNAMTTEFSLHGLPGSGRRANSFVQVFKISGATGGKVVAKQKICPVSGKSLGSMGQPVKVGINGEDVLVCCEGCVDRLKNNPNKYLVNLMNSPPMKSSKADAQEIAFQKNCPVMDEPLGSMGNPIKVRVKGRNVFLCCKGCIKMLKKEPNKYLAMIPSPEPAKATKVDSVAVANQKNCPVMDEPLNSMGGPWKVYAKGQPVYVCCKGCIKKVKKNPDFYLAKIENSTVK